MDNDRGANSQGRRTDGMAANGRTATDARANVGQMGCDAWATTVGCNAADQKCTSPVVVHRHAGKLGATSWGSSRGTSAQDEEHRGMREPCCSLRTRRQTQSDVLGEQLRHLHTGQVPTKRRRSWRRWRFSTGAKVSVAMRQGQRLRKWAATGRQAKQRGGRPGDAKDTTGGTQTWNTSGGDGQGAADEAPRH